MKKIFLIIIGMVFFNTVFSQQKVCSLYLQGQEVGRYQSPEDCEKAKDRYYAKLETKIKDDLNRAMRLKCECEYVNTENSNGNTGSKPDYDPALDPVIQGVVTVIGDLGGAIGSKYGESPEAKAAANEASKRKGEQANRAIGSGGGVTVPDIPQAKPKEEEICTDTSICPPEKIKKAKDELKLLNLE
jgi:hypothetical protein